MTQLAMYHDSVLLQMIWFCLFARAMELMANGLSYPYQDIPSVLRPLKSDIWLKHVQHNVHFSYLLEYP